MLGLVVLAVIMLYVCVDIELVYEDVTASSSIKYQPQD